MAGSPHLGIRRMTGAASIVSDAPISRPRDPEEKALDQAVEDAYHPERVLGAEYTRADEQAEESQNKVRAADQKVLIRDAADLLKEPWFLEDLKEQLGHQPTREEILARASEHLAEEDRCQERFDEVAPHREKAEAAEAAKQAAIAKTAPHFGPAAKSLLQASGMSGEQLAPYVDSEQMNNALRSGRVEVLRDTLVAAIEKSGAVPKMIAFLEDRTVDFDERTRRSALLNEILGRSASRYDHRRATTATRDGKQVNLNELSVVELESLMHGGKTAAKKRGM